MQWVMGQTGELDGWVGRVDGVHHFDLRLALTCCLEKSLLIIPLLPLPFLLPTILFLFPKAFADVSIFAVGATRMFSLSWRASWASRRAASSEASARTT